jgi:hypothetical protein
MNGTTRKETVSEKRGRAGAVICGAKTRAGHPCRRRSGNGRGGRCVMHGDRSTGPLTLEGRERIAGAQRARWRLWRANNARVLPELSRKQELRLMRRFSASLAAGAKTKPMDPRYAPRLARRVQRDAESLFATELMKANPPPRQCFYGPARLRWRRESR